MVVTALRQRRQFATLARGVAALGLAALLGWPAAAHALGADAWDTGFLIDFNEKWLRDDAINRALQQEREAGKPRSARGSSDFKTDILWTGPQTVVKGEFLNDSAVVKLAGMYPPAQRKQSAAMFTQVIASFNANVEKLYQVPPENVATGVAALLAGGYAAYHNRPFPDAWVRPLVLQIGDALRQKPALFEGKTTYKREAYQMAVGVGMLLLTAQAEAAKQRGADVSALKAAGGQVLQSVLGVSPDRIEFSSSGYRIR